MKPRVVTVEEIRRYGPTDGCEACRRRAQDMGKDFKLIRQNLPAGHTEECRQRIMDELKKSPEGRTRLEKEATRQTEAIFRLTEAEARKIDERLTTGTRQREGEGGSKVHGEDEK